MTGAIPADLSVILVNRFWTVCGDGAALSSEKHSGQGLQYFLDELDSGVDPIPVLEQVKLVGVDLDIMVILMHLLLPVRVNIYLTIRRFFTCLGDLPAKVIPLMVGTPQEVFAARRSVGAVLQVDHSTHLEGIIPHDRKSRPCERAGKTAGTDHRDLAFRGLTFVPLDCAAWLLER